MKWSHGQFNTYIAAAATNGKVAVYDLGRPGIEVARLHEHHRQVHKVAFNPFQGHLLLSGSQDGTVRLWDLRDMRSDAMTCRSRSRFMGQNEAVRDLKWSPKDGFEFAFGTDNGGIQKWDYRTNKAAKLRITAHEKTCTAIDWHPDGKHLLSASLDKMVKIWDFSTDVRRQKPAWSFRTPYPVLNARWRLPCWTNDAQGRGTWQCAQVATSYERIHPPVHIWDFRRPFMPFREIDNWTTAPTDMLWHSPDLLWSVSREGTFYQTDVQYAPKVIDRRPLQALAVSPTGEIAVFSQKRGRRRHSDLDYAHDDGSDGKGPRNSPEKAALSRSSFDDSVDESFLSSSYKRRHGRTASNRSAKSLSSTPPSYTETGVATLEDTLNKTKESFRPHQVAYRGILDGTLNSLHLVYLAQKYKTTVYKGPPDVAVLIDCRKAFEQNASYAQKTGAYRQAQTWRMFGLVVSSVVLRSASHAWSDIEKELAREEPPEDRKGLSVVEPRSEDGVSLPVNPAQRALLGGTQRGQKTPESTSNVTTPLVRPRRVTLLESTDKAIKLPNPDNEEQLNLPPSLVNNQLDGEGYFGASRTLNEVNQQHESRPTFHGPHWLSSVRDLEEHKAVMGSWRAPPRAPLDFESPQSRPSPAINIPPALDRHDSDESFGLFSQSSGSQKAFSLAASFSSRRSYSNDMAGIPEEREYMPRRDFNDIPQLDGSAPGFPDHYQSLDTRVSWSHSRLMSSKLTRPQSATTSFPTNSSLEMGGLMASGTIIPDEEAAYQDTDTKALGIPGSYGHELTKSAIQLLQHFRSQPTEDGHITSTGRKKALWLTQPIWDLSLPEMVEHVLSYYTIEVPDPGICAAILLLLQSIYKPCEERQLPALLGHVRKADFIRTSTLKIRAIFETYLDLLHAHGLLSAAAKARNVLTDIDQRSVATVRTVCSTCGRLLPEPPLPPVCSTCKARRGPCSICWSTAPAVKADKKSSHKHYLPGASGQIDSVNKAGLWLFCTACGHGAHFACRQMLLEACPESAGKRCSIETCLCLCLFPIRPTLAGRVRPEVVVGDEESRARESRAVKGARGLLERDKRVEFAGI